MAETPKVTCEELVAKIQAAFAQDQKLLDEGTRNVRGLAHLRDEIRDARQIKKSIQRHRSHLAK